MLQARDLNLGADFERAPSGLLLPAAIVPPPRSVGVDLFCGAGGFSCGFHQAGWHVAAAADGWATAAWTYLVNLAGPNTIVHCVGDLPDGTKKQIAWHAAHQDEPVPADEFLAMMAGGTGRGVPAGLENRAGTGWIAQQTDEPACEHFYLGDVRQLDGARVLADLGRTDVDAVFGGPPCQGFSTAGERQVMDPRNSLVFEFMRIVCEIRPKTFVMENVPGMISMLTPDGIPVIDAIARIAEDGGFGTYEAIRRSLLSHPDARAAVRTTPVGRQPGGRRGMAMDGRDRAAAEAPAHAVDEVVDEQLSMAIGAGT